MDAAINILVVVLVAGVAGNQITTTIHHGQGPWGILARLRAWAEQQDGRLAPLGELIGCPFCLSHSVCLVCTLVLGWEKFPFHVLVILAFASTWISQTVNDVLYHKTRMHKERASGIDLDNDEHRR